MAFSASGSNGHLILTGSSGADQLVIVENQGTVVVRDNGLGKERTYTKVTKLTVKVNGGNDRVDFTGNSVGALIYGGDGRDQLVVSDTGTGSSTLCGGNSNDDIQVLFANKTIACGDAGHDQIVVQASVAAGRTYLYGGSEHDTFTTYGGKNYIDGGSGCDRVIAFSGTNTCKSIERMETVPLVSVLV
jgi:Ca2+-binding RTX toxin-like protein